MHTVKAFLLLVVVLTIFYGCYPKYESSQTILIDQETKDFAVFQTGSWWLYQNKRTLALDTWKLFQFYLDAIVPASKSTEFNYELKILRFKRSLSNDTFDMYIEEKRINFISAKYFGQGQILYRENANDRVSICNNLWLRVLARDSINEQCVLRAFAYETYPCTTFFPSYVKWERYKGLTEYSYLDGDTFHLIDNHLIQ